MKTIYHFDHMNDEQTPIDTKYEFLAWNRGQLGEEEPITEAEALIFRAKDNALLPTLQFYYNECARLGCKIEHLQGVVQLIRRVEKWREQNPERCKVPD